MGAEMAICTNPFGYDEEEEDGEQLKPTESNGKKSSSKSSSSTSGRLHKWDPAAREAAEEEDKKYARSEGNRYIKNDDL
jgi:hypothetical protein